MGLAAQPGEDALHVVVVGKAVQPRTQGPQLLHGVGQLKVVVVVVAGVQGLVQAVVGHGVQPRVQPAAVLAVDHLAHQPEVRLEGIGELPQLPQEPEVQHVRRVQPQTVDIEFLHPEADGVQVVPPHGGILQVQLRQQLIAAPGLVAQAVVITVVAVEAHAVPVAVGRGLPALQQVPEGKKVPARVVEYRVEHHPEALVMAVCHKFAEVAVRAQPGIQQAVIGGLIAVAHGLEQRPDVQGVQAEARDMVHPGQEAAQPRHGSAAVVLRRSAGQAQGIDVIKGCGIIPVHSGSPFL